MSLAQMAAGFFAFYLSVSLLLRCSASPEPNTDAFFVAEFFRKMGAAVVPNNRNFSDVCSWPGVSCEGQFGKVTGLVASGLGLSGPIPATTIAKLSKLRVLDLGSNNITALSSDFGELCGSLSHLDLSGNSITGPLPTDISNFKLMESLDLSRNRFSGEITREVGLLTNLRLLNLRSNFLVKRIPETIIGCASLVSIDLSNNKLGGLLPVGFGSFFKNLTTMDLSGNRFVGKMPNLSSLPSLAYLNLSGNHFRDLVLGGLGQALQVVDLSKNQFHGLISQLLNLKVLDLSQNHLNGSIPELNTSNLRVMDLSRNNLTGEIPKSLQQTLPRIEKFNVSFNNLTYCAEKLSPAMFNSSFIGSQSDCPIAVNPDNAVSKGRTYLDLKLGFVIALSVFFSSVGLICIALGCRKRTGSWAIKQLSYREEQNVSGPFCFQTDSTTWVADVKLASSVPVVIFEKPLLNLTFADLLNATSNFDRGTLLEEGKFGPVYRGFLPVGIHVAMKVLVPVSSVTDEEAAQELERLGQIKHPNLVPLTGYCLAGEQRIVIYDYMENGNLQNLLHDLPLGVQSTEDWTSDTWEQDNTCAQSITTEGLTTWRFRHKIALGAARALAFLHHGCFPMIVHRDVKASSIYLDSTMEPRLADFGLSRLVGIGMESGNVMVHGSAGYAPPELSESENASATTKSDVYTFGVVLFELLTGKKPIGDEYSEDKETTLVGWARALVRRNELASLMDPKIRETRSCEKQMEEALRIAYLCTADLPSKRPSMQQIVGLLKDIEPAIVDH
ncbi:probable LRR receptor-like serine/threonine-protein kinase At2g24230 [Zingiber officinale]|uniref:probable LRR receptor-like serine/threonine-protein kinase At2g24230 n=1 Tax=Zingiber officinale TaxID=94328 RepID=UPI001C4C612D|nr:probable LRR receptor-like serine/threonine-protein kinase At2g24230 [Zingiber officinale]